MSETLFAAFTENPRSLSQLRRGAGSYVLAPCQIKEVLELPDTDYTALADDFRADYTFMRIMRRLCPLYREIVWIAC